MKISRIYESGDKIPGGKADNRLDSSFDASELRRGIEVELEHTNDEVLAKEIAKDHLAEDPKYYTKLATIHKD